MLHTPPGVISTEAKQTSSVISTEAKQTSSVISTEAKQTSSVISTEAKRSGETPAFFYSATSSQADELAPHPAYCHTR